VAGVAALVVLAALVNPVSFAVMSAGADRVASGYDRVLALRFIFLFVLLPTVALGLTADLVRAIARRRRSVLRGASSESLAPLPDVV
jgi:hypothetical protein